MRVAAYQMPVEACYGIDPVADLVPRVNERERAGVRILCCPEGALGGLADYVETPDEIAIPADADLLPARLRPLARRNVTVVVGSASEFAPNGAVV